MNSYDVTELAQGRSESGVRRGEIAPLNFEKIENNIVKS